MPAFAENDKVMCFSSATDKFAYLARVTKVEAADSGAKYHVHFEGWNKRYDIILDEEKAKKMLLKHSDALEDQHKEIRRREEGKGAKQQQQQPKKKAPETPVSKKRKNERSESVDSEASAFFRIDMQNQICAAEKLTDLVTDDGDIINRQGKLTVLPAKYTVDAIISEYQEMIASGGEGRRPDEMPIQYDDNTLKTLSRQDLYKKSNAIRDYLNCMLGSHLLYKAEREQYRQLIVDPTEDAAGERIEEVDEENKMKIVPSSIYGVNHLVRVFVRILPILQKANYQGRDLAVLSDNLEHFIVFLNNNIERFSDLERDYEVQDKHAREAANEVD